jgi:hypothetical protein
MVSVYHHPDFVVHLLLTLEFLYFTTFITRPPRLSYLSPVVCTTPRRPLFMHDYALELLKAAK